VAVVVVGIKMWGQRRRRDKRGGRKGSWVVAEVKTWDMDIRFCDVMSEELEREVWLVGMEEVGNL
jgi:hypothetical protein